MFFTILLQCYKSHALSSRLRQSCIFLQVLEKVKHENIVKLLAIEEEQEGRGKVSGSNFPQSLFFNNLSWSKL